MILVQSDPLKIVSTFHKYVKPTIHPILSPFCTLLTGISQEVVENSQTWQIVYQDFLDWLDVNAVDRNQCLFVSDGPWDVRDFIGKELNYHEISRPSFMHRILDIRKHYAKKYDRQSTNLNGMLLGLNMEFEGREHSGLDDAKNVYRIFEKMIADGFKMEANTDLRKNKPKKGAWTKLRK